MGTEPEPLDGATLDALLDPLFEQWIPRSFGTAGPGYLAYIPGGGVYPAALADFIADTANRYTGIWQAAPALVDATTGEVTLETAPGAGAVVSAGFLFDTPVRFDADRIEASLESFDAGRMAAVPLIEIRV